ncbi:MAG: hypothetical protein GX860_04030 [Alcaligenaceae bacterium]|jgi:hypothetical protein|nr:hypothetical protein [Alcaligenaceae bacterium]
MSKSISTLILLGVSVLIVLYILSAFHKVFNRESIHEQMAALNTETEGESQAVTSPTTEAVAQSIADLNEQIITSTAIAIDENTKSDSANTDTVAVTEEAPEETSISELTTEELAIDSAVSPGEILREKPHLQNALPPIPQAPPRPEGSAIVTAPSVESFSQTGNSIGSFPTPITSSDAVSSDSFSNAGSSSSFPAPFIPSTDHSTNSPQSSSSFPAPR